MVIKLGWCSTGEGKQLLSTLHVYFALIPEIRGARYVLSENILWLEIHGFVDSSKKAYGAVLYLRYFSTTGKNTVNLLSSNSRVALLKAISVPSLELCAALLLAKLLKRVIEYLKLNINLIKCYTDSTILLAWIRT